jgi:hypothetical protein
MEEFGLLEKGLAQPELLREATFAVDSMGPITVMEIKM